MRRLRPGWAVLVAAGLIAAGCTAASSSSAAGPASNPASAPAAATSRPAPKNLVPVAPVPLGGPIKGPVVLSAWHGDVKAYSLATLRDFETIAHNQGLRTSPISVAFIPDGKEVPCGPGGYDSDAGPDATDAFVCVGAPGTILIGPKTLAGERHKAKYLSTFSTLMDAFTNTQGQAYGTRPSYLMYEYEGCYDAVIMRWLYHAGQAGTSQVLTEQSLNSPYGINGFDPGFMTGRCIRADFSKDLLQLMLAAGYDAPPRK